MTPPPTRLEFSISRALATALWVSVVVAVMALMWWAVPGCE